MQPRRIAAGAMASLLAASALVAGVGARVASADPPTGGTTIVSETFTGSSVPDPSWTSQNDACLTGATAAPPAGAAQIPTCAGHRVGDVPPMGGTGYLQLTDESGNARGSVLYNRPVPASAGVSITLDQYQYGGNGADGIGFFLVDGSTNLTQAGGNGGSLGYAQIQNGAGTQPGIAGGVLGVGLDAYGNFYDDAENRGMGCPAGQRSPSTASGAVAPNVITLRGPGQGATGYCYLASTTPPNPANVNKPGTTLNGGTGTLRAATLTASWRQVNIQVTPAPSPRVIVQVRYHPDVAGDPWITELNVPAPANLPTTYKFGLSASTGGSNDVHLIRNALVKSINVLSSLQLEKQVDRSGTPLPATITAGTVIPYQFTVTNAGLETLTTLAIQDSRLTGPITCDRTTLTPAPAAGSTAVCRGTYTVTAADVSTPPFSVVNTATATARDAGNATVTSPPSTVTVPLRSSMSLTKAVVTPGPYVDLKQVQYTYTITNTGGSTLTNVAVTDNRITAARLSCLTNVLAPGASTTCTGTYTVDSAAANASGNIVNTATATGQTPIGQNVQSNQAQASIPVNTDIGVTKVVDNSTPDVGDTVTFTVTARNNGPSPATNVVVTDQLPVGRLTYVSSSTSGPQASTYDQAVGSWSIPALAVGNTVTLTLLARVETNTAVTNAATLSRLSPLDIDSSNNTDSATLNPVVPTLDLAVTKQVVGDLSVVAGDPARFRVTVTNNGPRAGSGITLLDVLPEGLTYDAAASSGDGSYDPQSQIWTVGSLAVGGQASFDFVLDTSAPGTFTNIVNLSAVTPGDTNPKNNSATASVVVRAPAADLSVVKGVFPQTAVVGDVVTYQVEVLNKGPDTVRDVFVDDTGPTGVTVQSSTTTQGTIDLDAGRWTVGTLAAGESARASITARLDTPGTKVNLVTVDAPLLLDPTPADNESTATLTTLAPAVDIGVTKSVARSGGGSVESVPLGDEVIFTLTARNNPVPGSPETTATNITLSDVLEAGLTFVSSAGAGTFDEATGTWSLPSLAVGETATRTILVTGSIVGQHTNTIGLATLDQRDVDPTNNSASATAIVFELADLAITKAIAPSTAQPGDTITVTVTVTNNGPNATDDIRAVDPGLTPATITGYTATHGTFDAAAHVWDIPHLDDGETATLTVSVLISATAAGPYKNTVAIQQSRVQDPVLANNTAQADLFVPVVDIAVTKTVDDPAPFVGDEVTFEVGLTNLGPDQADDVKVDDVLPAGLTYVSSTATSGDYDSASGVWDVGDLAPVDLPATGPQERLTVVARVDVAGTLTNTATSDRAGAFPYDPRPENNTDSAAVAATVPPADLAVGKTVEPAGVTLGDAVVFTLTVTNAGPGVAADSVLVDRMPDAVTPNAVSDNRCAIDGQVVTCRFGVLAVGDEVVVEVTGTATAEGTFTNVATVSSSSAETTTANNAAAVDGTVVAPLPLEPSQGGGPVVSGAGSGLPTTGTDPRALLMLAGLCLLGGLALARASRSRS